MLSGSTEIYDVSLPPTVQTSTKPMAKLDKRPQIDMKENELRSSRVLSCSSPSVTIVFLPLSFFAILLRIIARDWGGQDTKPSHRSISVSHACRFSRCDDVCSISSIQQIASSQIEERLAQYGTIVSWSIRNFQSRHRCRGWRRCLTEV